jgi:hypothetical protein
MLKNFKALQDLHILYPPALLMDPGELYQRGYDPRKEQHLIDNVVKPLLDALPRVTRVALGKRCVWERKIPGIGIEIVHEDDPSIGQGSFFDAGWAPQEPRDFGAQSAEGSDLPAPVENGARFVHMLQEMAGQEKTIDLVEIMKTEHTMNESAPHSRISSNFSEEEDDEDEEGED